MKPVIALVGRPNVGKSTLFNKLTRSRDALVADHAGLTRDRIYGTAEIEGCTFILIDTGGLTEQADDMSGLMRQQAQIAIEEADTIFFLVDGRAGLTAADEDVATQLRNADKPVILVVNKAEGERPEMMAADFYSLGLGEPQVISATQNRGISSLMGQLRDITPNVVSQRDDFDDEDDGDTSQVIRLAVMGRPNVGKSTLINRIMGEERVVAYDEPGTT